MEERHPLASSAGTVSAYFSRRTWTPGALLKSTTGSSYRPTTRTTDEAKLCG
jgi:hypothetical protein